MNVIEETKNTYNVAEEMDNCEINNAAALTINEEKNGIEINFHINHLIILSKLLRIWVSNGLNMMVENGGQRILQTV